MGLLSFWSGTKNKAWRFFGRRERIFDVSAAQGLLLVYLHGVQPQAPSLVVLGAGKGFFHRKPGNTTPPPRLLMRFPKTRPLGSVPPIAGPAFDLGRCTHSLSPGFGCIVIVIVKMSRAGITATSYISTWQLRQTYPALVLTFGSSYRCK